MINVFGIIVNLSESFLNQEMLRSDLRHPIVARKCHVKLPYHMHVCQFFSSFFFKFFVLDLYITLINYELV